jgi:hypothetical protein
MKRGILFFLTTIAQRNVKIFYSGLKKHRCILTGWNPTTGFDEPTVDTIILNETILDPILQMIGRGSRKLPNKDMFTVIDLEIMPPDLVLWSEPVNWHIFKITKFYLENLRDDTEIECISSIPCL